LSVGYLAGDRVVPSDCESEMRLETETGSEPQAKSGTETGTWTCCSPKRNPPRCRLGLGAGPGSGLRLRGRLETDATPRFSVSGPSESGFIGPGLDLHDWGVTNWFWQRANCGEALDRDGLGWESVDGPLFALLAGGDGGP